MCIRDRKGEFVFNRLAYVNEQYCFDVQKFNYQNGVIVKKLLNEIHIMKTKNKIRHELHGIIPVSYTHLVINKAASECYFKCCLAFCFNPVSIAWYKLQNQNYL